MIKVRMLPLLLLAIMISGCANWAQKAGNTTDTASFSPCGRRFYTGTEQTPDEAQDSEKFYPNDSCAIALQNQETRAVAYCYSNPETSAESCAQYFEKQGFVRLNELPYKTADYDFLKVDTYPTRRWRDAEITSRW